MKKVMIKAILFGWLFNASASLFFVLLIVSSLVAVGSSLTSTALIASLRLALSSKQFITILAVVSSIVLFLGGYLTARTAGRNEIVCAMLTGFLSLPLSVTPFSGGHSLISALYSCINVAMAFGGVLFGGYLGRVVNGMRIAQTSFGS